MSKVHCLGHNGEVNAADMMVNYQHKHHICKACHANIVKSKAKDKDAEVSRCIAEHADKAHEKAVKEVTALMCKPEPSKKLNPSLYQAIDRVRDEMEMAKLMRG